MRRIAVTLATVGLVAAGPVAGWIGSAVQSQATGALTCAQPFNPTVREVVNDVCKVFGP